MYPTASDEPWEGSQPHPDEIYNVDAMGYESLMLGLFTTFRCKYNIGGCAKTRYEYNQVYAGWSRDGFFFDKAPAGQRKPLLLLDDRY